MKNEGNKANGKNLEGQCGDNVKCTIPPTT